MRIVAAVSALIVIAFCAPCGARAQAREWELTEDSTVRFVCAGEGVTQAARGRFATLGGRIRVDPTEPAGARGAVQVEMVSITTWDAAWDTMFRRAPFLEIDEHPHARFDLRAVGAQGPLTAEWATITLEGAITVHGVERARRIPARARLLPAEGAVPERIEVTASFPVTWDEVAIRVPTGWTRRFAGDHAAVEVHLFYRPRA
jgi:polyisoprenoid-binding protein YceI